MKINTTLTLMENKVWRLEGALTFLTVNHVLKQSQKLWHDVSHLTIDFSAVDVTDSAALALMVEWQREAKKQYKKIRFLNLPKQLKKLTQISALDDILNVN